MLTARTSWRGRTPLGSVPSNHPLKKLDPIVGNFGILTGRRERTLAVTGSPAFRKALRRIEPVEHGLRSAAGFAPARVKLPDAPKCHRPGSRALSDHFKLHFGFIQEIAEGAAFVIPTAELVEVEPRTDRHCFSEVIQNETRG
jgi:hypothetical protein